MDEEQYQMQLREMSKHELVTLVTYYRNRLKEIEKLSKDWRQLNGERIWWMAIKTGR